MPCLFNQHNFSCIFFFAYQYLYIINVIRPLLNITYRNHGRTFLHMSRNGFK